ncbi:hypothetical protein QT231_22135 [Halomonas sp. SpR1]|uniref:hypothetical protein n=1 Tax=Halomonas sp. SpR1 TaxID=3050462 RepID=UPI0027E4FF63|nr:hypothetical protein [Halomonas sp. SpR1]MDQ7735410.1 hypothetical protein [Halomonas sp. SpR1]
METFNYASVILNAGDHYQKLLGSGKLSGNYINNASYYRLNANDSPLLTNSSSAPQSNSKATVVELSSTAMKISDILLKENITSSSSTNFDSFLKNISHQLQELGEGAEILLEKPNSANEERIAISEQAANYLLSKYYNAEPLYPESSSENPFAGLDRHSLSKIAFDDSGDFTSPERYLAFMEMTENDIDFRNKGFELEQERQEKQFETEDRQGKSENWGNDIDLQDIGVQIEESLISAMTEAEKNWRGISDSSEKDKNTLSNADTDRKPSNITTSLPEYNNGLKKAQDSFFAIISNDQGQHSLISIDIQEINKNSHNLNLLDSALRTQENNHSDGENSSWVPYQNIL